MVNVFQQILLNIILLVFPLIFNLFYWTYSNNIDKEQSKTFLDFALLSSIYLLITFNDLENNLTIVLLFNIPLIFAYIKKRSYIGIIISIILVYIYYGLGMNIFLLIFEYIVYFIIYLLTYKRKKSLFLILFFVFKSLFSISTYFIYDEKFYLINSLLMLVTFIVITYLIIYMYNKGEDIIKLHMSIKELENDKQIRDSLFKITHEIKNPIAVCKSYLDMFDINNKEHIKYINILKEENEKILLLLQDFLAMNKIKIQKEILDINMLLEDVVDQLTPLLKGKNIKVDYDIALDEVFIEGDYNRLNQVFINMIKNSVEALDNTKKPKISLNHKIDGNKFIISIEDNGSGINESDMERIKEPFYTTKKNGTGLGVSLSCEIISAHDGTLEYFSKVNEGTKVVISLPIYEVFD